ncbi:hypothetical protein [Halorientalis marina]|uniref:hypothetical protein n=1 Tax=Halorientalis marina TaxID=2931976 RepID=UPI001FF37D83|nr:hypothetical protein [Halorientalis marina]
MSNENKIPTLMVCTPGITAKRFTRDPIGTEGEFSPGDDRVNPYRSVDEREEVERVKAKRDRQEKRGPQRDDVISTPFAENSGNDLVKVPIEDPTADPDPFAFDDVSFGNMQLPGLGDGPRF